MAKKQTVLKESDREDDGKSLMRDLLPLMDKAFGEHRKGCKYTPAELEKEVKGYFEYCNKTDLKPSKSGLRLYLGIHHSTYHEWQSKPEKYGNITDIIQTANDIMETQYIQRLESNPTGNIFLLKTAHGFQETTKVDITSNNQINPNEINDVIGKLGLDKPKSE